MRILSHSRGVSQYKKLAALAPVLFLAACLQTPGEQAPLTVLTPPPETSEADQDTPTTLPLETTTAPLDPEPEEPVAEVTAPALPSNVEVRRRTRPVQQVDVPPVQQEGDTVKIALLLPLSGENAELGALLFNAAELALFQLGSSHIELLPRDTGGTAEGAAQAAQNALASGAQLILGPVFASSVRAVAPIAQLGRVTVLAFTTDRRLAGDGVFVMGYTPEEQVARILQYSGSQGLTQLAALVPDTPYGNKVLNAVNRVGAQYGTQLLDIVQYPPDAESLSDRMKNAIQDIAQYGARREAWEIRKNSLESRLAADPDNTALQRQLEAHNRRDTIGGVNYQALVLPESGARLRVVASLLPHYDVDPGEVQLLGTGLWADPSLGREPALQGGWFAAPSLQADTRFRTTYERAYGTQPPLIASLVYDSIALATILAPNGVPNYTLPALTNPNGFRGSQGIFRLLPEGVVEHGLAVIELTPDGFQEIDPAPTSFQVLTN